MRMAGFIKVQETVKFDRELHFQAPNGITEDELDDILNEADRNAQTIEDYADILERHGLEVNQDYDREYDSPTDSELECDDYEFGEVVGGEED